MDTRLPPRTATPLVRSPRRARRYWVSDVDVLDHFCTWVSGLATLASVGVFVWGFWSSSTEESSMAAIWSFLVAPFIPVVLAAFLFSFSGLRTGSRASLVAGRTLLTVGLVAASLPLWFFLGI